MKLCARCGSEKHKPPSGGYRCKLCDKKRAKEKREADPEKAREYKARGMARYRKDPELRERMRQSRIRSWNNGGKERDKEAKKKMRLEQPFKWRAALFRAHYKSVVTEDQLVDLWNKQQGKCAITGRDIVVCDAHLDHIVPVSRGGTHDLSNLRWVCKQANHAKRNLLDDEFLALCASVREWFAKKEGLA